MSAKLGSYCSKVPSRDISTFMLCSAFHICFCIVTCFDNAELELSASSVKELLNMACLVSPAHGPCLSFFTPGEPSHCCVWGARHWETVRCWTQLTCCTVRSSLLLFSSPLNGEYFPSPSSDMFAGFGAKTVTKGMCSCKRSRVC